MTPALLRLPAVVLAIIGACGRLDAAETPAAKEPAPSKAQQVLDRASAENKFTFLVFYNDGAAAARTVANVAKDGVAKRQDRALLTFVQIMDPAEQELVARFDVARAPLPLTLAVAPNGAITGVFAQKLNDANFDEALVTPTMTKCMKSLQEGKLVFVCLQTSDEPVVPIAVQAFQTDPLFKDRLSLVSMQLNDPAETRFLNQMQIDASRTPATTSVLLAPPGVLIGKYGPSVSKDEMAAALHKAGKCCDDANCKHNPAHTSAPRQPSAGNSRPATQPAGRN